MQYIQLSCTVNPIDPRDPIDSKYYVLTLNDINKYGKLWKLTVTNLSRCGKLSKQVVRRRQNARRMFGNFHLRA